MKIQQDETEHTEPTILKKISEPTPKQRKAWYLHNRMQEKIDALHESAVYLLEEKIEKVCDDLSNTDMLHILGLDRVGFSVNQERVKYESIRQGSEKYDSLKPPHPYWISVEQRN